ncbi:MAG: hypothetical protein WC565_04610 [Parcubacteria group bacterium]
MKSYDVGDLVRLDCALVNSSGVATDPTTLTLTVKPGDGTAVSYTYAAGEITKDSVGNYHKDYTVPTGTGGTVYYKFTATGTAIGMEPGSFAVRNDDTA